MRLEVKRRSLIGAVVGLSMIGALFSGANPSAAHAEESTPSTVTAAASTTITNNTFYKDAEGNNIYSQGGGMYDFKDPQTGQTKHYWYGIHFKAAEQYASNPSAAIKTTDGKDASLSFESVDAYSSTDLVNWEREGAVFTKDEANNFPGKQGDWQQAGWICRMGVAHLTNAEGKDIYAIFIQHEVPTKENPGKNDWDKKVAIATSDSPTGPFKIESRVSAKNWGDPQDNTGDQTVFTDQDTGKSYLIYSNGSGRAYLYVGEIGLNADGKVDVVRYQQIYRGAGMEGDAMFKYKGKYYFTGSDLHGWNASPVHYLVSDNIWGPYKNADGAENVFSDMKGSTADFAYVTQTGFYYTVKDPVTQEDKFVLYCGDRWSDFAGNGAGFNQWVPISFGDDGFPYFNSLSSWNLNASKASWSVGDANNYVLNGGFEADRVAGSGEGTAGWAVSGADADAFNRVADKAGRTGNFYLNLWKESVYSATFTQTIESGKNGNASLPDGEYTLTADVRGDVGANKADVVVTSAGKTSTIDVTQAEGYNEKTFSNVVLTGIAVSGGKAEVSIDAKSIPGGQWLNLDDIVLTRVGDLVSEGADDAVPGGVNVKRIDNLSKDFIRGADMSSALALEKAGVKFKNAKGQVSDIFTTVHDAGVNYVRVRVWNQPSTDAGKTYGAGNTDTDTAVEIGKRATDAGMKVLVDFHYSDFWADPGKYKVPKKWESMNIEEKSDALKKYTEDTLTAFKTAGVGVGMVQIGNEINGGLAGEKSGSTNYFALLKAGSAGVRRALPDALVAVHYANPEKGLKGWADSLAKNNIDYNVFGSSYYPAWHGTTDNLKKNLNYIADTYNKKVMVAETSWAYTYDDADGSNMITSDNGIARRYDISVQGQADEIRDVANTVNDVDKDAGLGFFWWEPAWLPVTNDGIHSSGSDYIWNTTGAGWATQYASEYDNGAKDNAWGGSGVDNQALFDVDGYPLASLQTYRYLYTGAVIPDSTNLISDGDFEGENTKWTVSGSSQDADNNPTGVWIGTTTNGLPPSSASINFWNSSSFKGSVLQKVTGLVPGKYILSADSYGGGSNAGTNAALVASTSVGSDYSQNIVMNGWQQKATNFMDIEVGDNGIATVGFSISSSNGGEWGSVDNLTLLPQGDTQVAQPVRHSVDKKELEAAISEADNVDAKKYTDESYAPVKILDSYAKTVRDYKDSQQQAASQSSIDVATKQLTIALDALDLLDTTKPVFNGISDVTLDVGESFDPLRGVVAHDDVDGDLSNSITVKGSVDTSMAGSYELTYSVSDKAGNVTVATRVVTVRGTKPSPETPVSGKAEAGGGPRHSAGGSQLALTGSDISVVVALVTLFMMLGIVANSVRDGRREK